MAGPVLLLRLRQKEPQYVMVLSPKLCTVSRTAQHIKHNHHIHDAILTFWTLSSLGMFPMNDSRLCRAILCAMRLGTMCEECSG